MKTEQIALYRSTPDSPLEILDEKPNKSWYFINELLKDHQEKLKSIFDFAVVSGNVSDNSANKVPSAALITDKILVDSDYNFIKFK